MRKCFKMNCVFEVTVSLCVFLCMHIPPSPFLLMITHIHCVSLVWQFVVQCIFRVDSSNYYAFEIGILNSAWGYIVNVCTHYVLNIVTCYLCEIFRLLIINKILGAVTWCIVLIKWPNFMWVRVKRIYMTYCFNKMTQFYVSSG